MTGLHHTDTADDSTPHDARRRDLHREQLSAMMDGALPADEARFLLRRMEHDDELADCWQRWQFFGDAMRGQAGRALPTDFSRRVGRAIADDIAAEQHAAAVAGRGARSPLLRWGGGAALAATVALAALIGGRGLMPAADSTEVAETRPVAGSAPVADSTAPSAPEAPAPSDMSTSATVLAVAAASTSRDRTQRRLATQASRDAASTPATTIEPSLVDNAALASAPSAILSVDDARPALADASAAFGPNTDRTPKPWPRALLPEAAAGGMRVDYGVSAATSNPLRPFVVPTDEATTPELLRLSPAYPDPARRERPSPENAATATP